MYTFVLTVLTPSCKHYWLQTHLISYFKFLKKKTIKKQTTKTTKKNNNNKKQQQKNQQTNKQRTETKTRQNKNKSREDKKKIEAQVNYESNLKYIHTGFAKMKLF